MSQAVSAIVHGQSLCPNDQEFVHEGWPYGCVPADFKMTTGRSRSHKQTATATGSVEFPTHVWLWDGGCDAAGLTDRSRRVAQPALPTTDLIVRLDMGNDVT